MLIKQQVDRYKELEQEQKSFYKRIFRKTKRVYFLSVIFGGVIGGILGAKLAEYEEQTGYSFAGGLPLNIHLVFLIIMIVLAFILHIILHEGGHLIGGLLTGYQFRSFRVFSFIFYKKDGRLHRGKYSIKGTAGQCLMFPPKKNHDGSFPFILYNLGGGISNLIFSLFAILIYLLVNNGYLRLSLMIFALIGLLTAFNNLIPMSLVIQNDGMNLKNMLKNKYSKEAFYLQLQLNAEMSEGKSITEYSEDVFKLPDGVKESDMLILNVRFYSYYRMLALHDFKAAKELLEYMDSGNEKYSQASYNFIQMEKLFFLVLEKRPAEEIASLYKYIKQLLKTGKNNISMKRINYAYEILVSEEEKKDIESLILKGKKRWVMKDKEKLYQEFMEAAEKYPVQGEAKLFMDIVDYINETMAYVI